jgi:hypothetical protein
VAHPVSKTTQRSGAAARGAGGSCLRVVCAHLPSCAAFSLFAYCFRGQKSSRAYLRPRGGSANEWLCAAARSCAQRHGTMKAFFSNLVSPKRVKNRRSRPAQPEAASCGGERRSSINSNEAVEIRIDDRRSSGDSGGSKGRWAHRVEVGHSGFNLSSPDGRVAIVGSGNFGVQACSKEDFMQIQTSVMDAFARAEAQFGDDEEFAGEIESEIDILFDEFEQLKELLVRAQHGDCDTDIERDVTRLKRRIQDIVGRINEADNEYCLRRGIRSGGSSDDESEGADAGAATRGIGALRVTS